MHNGIIKFCMALVLYQTVSKTTRGTTDFTLNIVNIKVTRNDKQKRNSEIYGKESQKGNNILFKSQSL